jgi:hypothetical protein
VRPVVRAVGTAGGDEVDLVGADAEELPQPAELGHLGGAAAALPEVDRLRLDADLERYLELGPSPLLPQHPNGLHAVRLLSSVVTLTYKPSSSH